MDAGLLDEQMEMEVLQMQLAAYREDFEEERRDRERLQTEVESLKGEVESLRLEALGHSKAKPQSQPCGPPQYMYSQPSRSLDTQVTIEDLRAQMAVYHEDFERERKNRDQLQAERESLKEDIIALRLQIKQQKENMEPPADTCETQLTVQDRRHSNYDVRHAEMDLRFQILETASYDGTLLWKIKDYNRRKHEAVTGRALTLYSQPFYPSQFGYDMCARVYLNGDGMGAKKCAQKYMNGDGMDDKMCARMYLNGDGMGDKMGARSGQENETDTFRPDPTSSSFKHPTSDMNIASGCPLWIDHEFQSELKAASKSITMLVRFVVQTNLTGQ